MSATVLQTHNLSKTYGSVVAVNDVNLKVYSGDVFGFLGPNGAGKTTTIGMALGLIHPSAGQVEIAGQPVGPNSVGPLRQVGSLMGRPALVPYLSGQANLRLLAHLYSQVDERRVDRVLDRVGLSDAAQRKVKAYSTGMKQRLGLAAALLHRPSLIILDEPTNGLDPAGMRDVRNLIRSLAENGTTIFLSSHLLHEVEQVCDRFAIINKGRVVTQGSAGELLNQRKQVVKIRVPSPVEAAQALQSLPGITNVETNGATLQITGASSEAIISHLYAQGIVPGEVTVQNADLESLFLELTQS